MTKEEEYDCKEHKRVKAKKIKQVKDGKDIILECGHKISIRNKIKENVKVSDTLKSSLIKAVKEAKEQIQNDGEAIRILQNLKENEKVPIKSLNANMEKLDKLRDFGMVTIYLNDFINISRIGNYVLNNLSSPKLNLEV
jgi:hypothetical protein